MENAWQKALEGTPFDVSLGHGRVLIRSNGEPVAQVCGFVDNFMIHARTKRNCIAVLSTFVDNTVRLGFICQKTKTLAPSQVQKHCGTLCDTAMAPTPRIPTNKVSRCIASAQFLLKDVRSACLSRLSHWSVAISGGCHAPTRGPSLPSPIA